MPRYLPIEAKIAIVCLKLANLSTMEIAAELGVSQCSVKTYGTGLRPRSVTGNNRPPRTVQEQQRMLAAWDAEDVDLKEVAHRFGYSSANSMRNIVNRIKAGKYG